VLRTLNWSGIAFGVGAGLILGLVLSAVVRGSGGPVGLQVVVQVLAFVVAGFIAGRFSLVGAIAAGGFAGLLLYFGLAVFAIIAGTELSGVALVFFGLLALAFGSAGALLAEAPRRRR
jgi:hypothetical protein